MMDSAKEANHMFGNLFGGGKKKPDSCRRPGHTEPEELGHRTWNLFSSDVTKGDLSDFIDRRE
jgi:hypothetical protein